MVTKNHKQRVNRNSFWERAFCAAMNGLLAHADKIPAARYVARLAAEFADAALEVRGEKR